jgi:hypothetical protein
VCGWEVAFDTAVMLHGRSYIPSLLAVIGP